MKIYLARNNVQAGPYTLPEFNQMVADGQIEAQDLMWHSGMPEWKTVANVLAGVLPYTPTQNHPTAPIPTPVVDSTLAATAPTTTEPLTQQPSHLLTIPAPWNDRILAKIIDTALWLPAAWITLFFISPENQKKLEALGLSADAFSQDPRMIINMVDPIGWFFVLGYLFVMFAVQAYLLSTKGQSIGKKAMHLMIVAMPEPNENKGIRPYIAKPNFVQFFLTRTLLFSVLYRLFSPLFIIDMVWALFNPNRRALHDIVAKTQVAKISKLKQ